MARTVVAQPSFARGEISPRLYGRVDTQAYQSGAEAIENYIVRPEGGLMRRHGTRFAGEQRDHTKVNRLIPFVFSTVQAYMLEFCDQKIRVWKDYAPVASNTLTITAITKANPAVVSYTGTDPSNGERVVITSVGGMGQVNNREFTVANVNAGANTFELSGINSSAFDTYTSGGEARVIYEIASPYLEADLPAIFYSQSADVLYLAHPSYAPRTLTRTGHTSWTLATLSLTKGPFTPLNTTDSTRVRIEASAYVSGTSVTIKANEDIFESDHVGGLFYMREMLLDQLAVSPWASGKPSSATVGTQCSSNGHVYAVVDSKINANCGTVAPSHTQGDEWDNPIAGGGEAKKWRYLHSRTCIFLITAYTDAKTVTATALSYIPHGFNQPSVTISGAANNGAGLVRITATAHGYADGDYVFIASVGGTTEANGYWQIRWVSVDTFDLVGSTFANSYTSGGTSRRFATWLWAHGAFSAARGYPAAVAFHEQRLCFANTEAQPFGFWASRSGDFTNFEIGTEDDDSIGYDIAANQVDPIRWLASGSDLLIGTLAQEFAGYGGGLGNPITPTNTRIVPQSGEGSNGVQPVKVGTELLFSNRAGRKIYSFLTQADVGGYVAGDLVELAEHLFGPSKTITAMAWAKNPASVLWVLRSDGVLVGLTYRREQQLIACHRHIIGGTGVEVESIAVIPSSDGTVDDLWMTVKRTINGGTKRYVEYLSKPFEPSSSTDKDSMGFVDSALQYSGTAASSMSGLYHLEGETVKVVADGALHGDCVVSGGEITLDAAYTNVWAGLGYTSRVRTLRLDQGAMGTAQAKTKRIPRVTVRVYNSIGGKCGPADEATMEDLVRRNTDDPMDASPPMRSGDFEAFIASDFDLAGQIAILQSEPMPLDIIAIFPLQNVSEG